jgi:hypothetical protein
MKWLFFGQNIQVLEPREILHAQTVGYPSSSYDERSSSGSECSFREVICILGVQLSLQSRGIMSRS